MFIPLGVLLKFCNWNQQYFSADSHGNRIGFHGVAACVGDNTLIQLRRTGCVYYEGEGIGVVAAQIAVRPSHATIGTRRF